MRHQTRCDQEWLHERAALAAPYEVQVQVVVRGLVVEVHSKHGGLHAVAMLKCLQGAKGASLQRRPHAQRGQAVVLARAWASNNLTAIAVRTARTALAVPTLPLPLICGIAGKAHLAARGLDVVQQRQVLRPQVPQAPHVAPHNECQAVQLLQPRLVPLPVGVQHEA